MLQKGEVNLVTLSMTAKFLMKAHRPELLEQIRNKTQREVEVIKAMLEGPAPARDRVKPVCVAVPVVQEPDTKDLTPAHSHSGSSPGVSAVSVGGSEKQPRTLEMPAPVTKLEQKFQIEFTVSKAFMAKYQEVVSLLSSKGAISFEAVFETIMNDYIERHSPKKRAERRKRRKQKAKGQEPKPRVVAKGDGPDERSRYISPAVRDKVCDRDQGRCTYKSANGRRCGATRNLQIDHVVPFGRGGTNAANNLRLLCAQHNKLEAERHYGPDTMEQFTRRE